MSLNELNGKLERRPLLKHILISPFLAHDYRTSRTASTTSLCSTNTYPAPDSTSNSTKGHPWRSRTSFTHSIMNKITVWNNWKYFVALLNLCARHHIIWSISCEGGSKGVASVVSFSVCLSVYVKSCAITSCPLQYINIHYSYH